MKHVSLCFVCAGRIQGGGKMERCRILYFNELGDDQGNLVAIEDNQEVPFDIKRVFYLYGTNKTMIRGRHANRNSQFVLINVAGSSKVKICYSKDDIDIISLDKPRMGIYIPRMVWKEMYDFSSDSVILCLTDTHYNPDEYIRDYDEYLREIREHC